MDGFELTVTMLYAFTGIACIFRYSDEILEYYYERHNGYRHTILVLYVGVCILFLSWPVIHLYNEYCDRLNE